MIKISPSILSADFAHLAGTLKQFPPPITSMWT